MHKIHQPERETQSRVVELFRQRLRYDFIANRSGSLNGNINEKFLEEWILKNSGYAREHAAQSVRKLREAAVVLAHEGLYAANQRTYELLLHGADVRIDPDETTKSVHFIDWTNPANNHFAIAEEVFLPGPNQRRIDIVLYINGIAIAILELKNSRVSVGQGIRQTISNHRRDNPWFFSTVQFLFAGNDTEGLHYAPIGTPNKNFLQWKESATDNHNPLDRALIQICQKERFLEIIRDFILFDGNSKKLPRAHQYLAVKNVQKQLEKHSSGGIIWHTQGSGKSLVMIFLARWILRTYGDARVLIILDRKELENQIQRFFEKSNNKLEKAHSSAELMDMLRSPSPRLFSSLVHKFREQGRDEFQRALPETSGRIFVFVDECHRTESGILHRQMRAALPDSIFIGFTGTPLIKSDKPSVELFGPYIHTYKYKEAVNDRVVLDLAYEGRHVEQQLKNSQEIDRWFENKTQGMGEIQRQKLRRQWATKQNVLSSKNRIRKIVADMCLDFSTQPRLSSGYGTAMLVAGSIYEACRYRREFAKMGFRHKCAVITSYNPRNHDISTEDTGTNTETNKELIYNVHKEMFTDLGVSSMEECEKNVIHNFLHEPSKMQILIVVDRLLTGFDAPSCTFLYIDKTMRDHSLFQAMCRANRLDGDDKTQGFIIDYKESVMKIHDAMQIYASELDPDREKHESEQIYVRESSSILRERMEHAMKNFNDVIAPIPSPKCSMEYIDYFQREGATKRNEMYKAVSAAVRACANLTGRVLEAGYGEDDFREIKRKIQNGVSICQIVRLASNEYLDTKPYEADMRHLMDEYITAESPRNVLEFDSLSLLDAIASNRSHEMIQAITGVDREDVAAKIIYNNIRAAINDRYEEDPHVYGKISEDLQKIIDQLHDQRISYELFCSQSADIAARIKAASSRDGRQIISDYLIRQGKEPASAIDIAARLHDALLNESTDDWRGNRAKENEVKAIIADKIHDDSLVGAIFHFVFNDRKY